MEENPYQSPVVAVASPIPSTERYSSIGGWLVLIGIGIVFTPVKLLIVLLTIHRPLFTQGTIVVLMDPAHPNYHPLFVPLVVFEVIVNVVFIVWSTGNIYWFFGRRRFFPAVFITFVSVSLGVMFLDLVLMNMIPFIAASNDLSQLKEVIQSIVAACIWIPYFLVSKRVKGTFTR